MIFYFSGTGNSAWVARQLAHLTGDVACDITTLAHTPDVQKEEQVGFVFPVYAWGASEVMTNFASKLARPQGLCFQRLYLWQRGRADHETLCEGIPLGQQLQFGDAE